MKIAVINDIHFGKMSDNEYLMKYYKKSLENVFFKMIEKYDIDYIIDIGDIFDNRTKVNTKTLKEVKKFYFDALIDKQYDVVLGNHDCYFPNRNDINTPSTTLFEYNNVQIFDKPSEVSIGGTKFLYLPWINKSNAQETVDLIKSTDAKVCFGHLELSGFDYDKFQVAKKGLNPAVFKKFDHVFSGHYHIRSSKGNITYLGSPMQQTWVDQGVDKFFYVFDTETFEMTPVKNPYSIFKKIIYKEDMEIDADEYKDCFVKMYVDEYESKTALDKVCTDIENVAVKFDISYNHKKVEIELDDNEEIEVEDTLSIISSSVEDVSVRDILETSYKENI